MKLSVVIPSYNEEKRLPKTLDSVNGYLDKQDYESEVIVVSDGSTDRTVEVAREKGVKVINNKENHGKGYVTRQGMLEAKGEIRLFMDADNATTIDHIERMWPDFEHGYEVVICTRDPRDMKEAQQVVKQSFIKRFVGDLGNLVIQLLLVPNIWDTQCGFKAFTAKATEDIFSKMKIERWAFDVEALALARKLEYDVALVPADWVNDPNSTFNLKGYVRFFKEFFQIKWWFITGQYE